jgi:hypothetical protein
MTRSTFFDNSDGGGNSKKIKNRIDAVESTIATHGNVVTRNIASGSFIANTDIYDVAYVNQALIDAAAVADTTINNALSNKQDLITSSTTLTVNQLIGEVKESTLTDVILGPNWKYGNYVGYTVRNSLGTPVAAIEFINPSTGAHNWYGTSTAVIMGWQPHNNRLYVSGSMLSTAFNTTSDNRLKHNESGISNALDIVNKLKPVSYYRTDEFYEEDTDFPLNEIPEGAEWSSGYIAQAVKAIPELAHNVAGEEYDEDGQPAALSINYTGIQPFLCKAIQELLAKNNALEERIAALESNV